MKIRIKGNTVRIRLSRPEVETFCETGLLEERTDFLPQPFVYTIRKDDSVAELQTVFQNGKFQLLVPSSWIAGWEHSEKVGFETVLTMKNGGAFRILLEKDFKCLDETQEDQSDQYENPLKIIHD